MKKILLIAVCLIVLASTASAIYNVSGLTQETDEGQGGAPQPLDILSIGGGLVDPIVEGAGDSSAPLNTITEDPFEGEENTGA